MHKSFLATGALLACLAVILGAFGAHSLKSMVPPETVSSFQTGVQYQFYHAFAILLTGIVYEKFPFKIMKWAGHLFLAGIVLFSGSLYALTMMKATEQVGLGSIGIITPIGGVLFITGWLCFFIAIVRQKN